MKRRSLDDVDPQQFGDDSTRRGLTEPLGTTDVAINHYRIPPGDALPSGLHAHADQEEVFVVLAGTAAFETLDGEVTVSRGEAIRFGPGEFQSGRNAVESGADRNAGDDELVVLAVGAPRETEDVRVPLSCPDCGHDDLRIDAGADGVALLCPACGVAHDPPACPECGHEDLRVTLGEADTVVVACPACGTVVERPFA
jgi:uncharacterized cupin superfamily protein